MSRPIKKIRILLADDHEIVRQGVRRLLHAQQGLCVVGEAADGREAVQKIKKLKPNVAIVDIEMPELDGLEVTRQVREAAPQTQVLILTMHESGEMVRKVLEAGARGFVLKSDLAHYLVRVIKGLAKGKLSLTPKVSEIVLNGFVNARNEPTRGDSSQIHPTPREVEVIQLLARGKANKQIAAAIGITVRTVEAYRARIMLKFKFESLSDLVLYAVHHKLVQA